MKNKLPMMLLALLLAVLVWLYDVTVVNPNDALTFSGIPVAFENEDIMRAQDLMVDEGSSPSVTLRISGRRSELKKLSRLNIQVSVDLSQIREAGTHELPYTVRYPANVNSADLSIDNRTPAAVSVAVEHYIRRLVPITTELVGKLGSGTNGESYAVDTGAIEIDPAEVAVTGPAELVESIESAHVVIDQEGITQTTAAECEFTLLDENGDEVDREGLVTDCETLSVTVPVHKLKEVPLVVKTVPGGGAVDDNIHYKLSVNRIKISGESAVIDRISQIELGTLRYAEVTGPVTRSLPVIMPEGVNNVSGITSVDMSVEVSGLKVITMNMSEFEFVNIPEGLTPASDTEAIPLTLRGTPAALSNLEPDDVTVTVDLSGFTQAGTYIVAVTVEVPEGLQIGAIGNTSVTVTLS